MAISDSKQAAQYLKAEASAAGLLGTGRGKKAFGDLLSAIDTMAREGSYAQGGKYNKNVTMAMRKRDKALSDLGLDPSVFSMTNEIRQWWDGTFNNREFINRAHTSLLGEILNLVRGKQSIASVTNLIHSPEQMKQDAKTQVDAILASVSHGYQSGSETTAAFDNRIDEYAKARLRGIGTYVTGATLTPVDLSPAPGSTVTQLGLRG